MYLYIQNDINTNDNLYYMNYSFTFNISDKKYKIVYLENKLLCYNCYKKRNINSKK